MNWYCGMFWVVAKCPKSKESSNLISVIFWYLDFSVNLGQPGENCKFGHLQNVI